MFRNYEFKINILQGHKSLKNRRFFLLSSFKKLYQYQKNSFYEEFFYDFGGFDQIVFLMSLTWSSLIAHHQSLMFKSSFVVLMNLYF